MRMAVVLLAVVAVPAMATGTAGSREAVVRVRASAATAPCVAAAVAGESERVQMDAGPLRDAKEVDVLVGPSAEIDRALESGAAFGDSDEGLGDIAWVLVRPPSEAGTLADLGRAGAEITVLAGPDGAEARRVVGEVARLREAGASELLAARLAVVPQSLVRKGAGTRLEEVRPIRARAAVLRSARDPEAARRLVARLASESGRRAFAECGGSR